MKTLKILTTIILCSTTLMFARFNNTRGNSTSTSMKNMPTHKGVKLEKKGEGWTWKCDDQEQWLKQQIKDIRDQKIKEKKQFTDLATTLHAMLNSVGFSSTTLKNRTTPELLQLLEILTEKIPEKKAILRNSFSLMIDKKKRLDSRKNKSIREDHGLLEDRTVSGLTSTKRAKKRIVAIAVAVGYVFNEALKTKYKWLRGVPDTPGSRPKNKLPTVEDLKLEKTGEKWSWSCKTQLKWVKKQLKDIRDGKVTPAQFRDLAASYLEMVQSVGFSSEFNKSRSTKEMLQLLEALMSNLSAGIARSIFVELVKNDKRLDAKKNKALKKGKTEGSKGLFNDGRLGGLFSSKDLKNQIKDLGRRVGYAFTADQKRKHSWLDK
jgi:hypothetical protein